MKKLITMFAGVAALCVQAIDITANTTVTDADVATYADADIDIAEGSTLTFHNLTAAQTFTGTLTGGGAFVVKSDAENKNARITFNGDATGLTGGIFVTNHLVTVEKPAAIGSSKFTLNVRIASTKCYFNGPGEYTCPLEVNVCETHPYGLVFAEGVVASGPVLWRFGRICGPGRVTGQLTIVSTCYGQDGIHFAGGINGGGGLNSDNGVLYIESSVSKINGISVVGSSPIYFGVENALHENQNISIGAVYNPRGVYNLCGFNQRCKTVNVSQTQALHGANQTGTVTGFRSDEPATLTILDQTDDQRLIGNLFGAISLDYSSTAQRRFRLCGEINDTTGKLTVRSGTLAADTNAVFSALSGIEVLGSGVFEFCAATDSNGRVVRTPKFNAEKLKLSIGGEGKIKLPAGCTLEVNELEVDGVALAAGTYSNASPNLAGRIDGDGIVHVLAIDKKTEGAAFTWKGGTDGDALATAANWEGGAAPMFDGTERLIFGEAGSSARAVVSGVANVFAIEVRGNAPFEFAAADGNSKIVLQQGGFTLTNTVDQVVVRHEVACPVELGYVPQEWNITTNTQFNNLAPLSGPWRVTPEALTIRGPGRMYLRADNSQLHPHLVFTDCKSDLAQPYVYHGQALGSPVRATEFHYCVPRFMNDSGVITNTVPLHIMNNITGKEYVHMKDSYGTNPVYIDAPVTYYGVGAETYLKGLVHFRGGLYHEDGMSITLRFPGGGNWVEGDVGFMTTDNVSFDYSGTINIGAKVNQWKTLALYKCTAVLHATNTLAPGGAVQMSHNNDAYRSKTATLDLNGFDQRISRIFNGFGKSWFETHFSTVKSDAPAVLEIAQSAVNDDLVALKFMGEAGLKFNAPGSISFTNYVSDTTGSLAVEKGSVRFCAGAGWVNAKSVSVGAEGVLAVGPGAGATAFGTEQGRSDADVTLAPGGVFEIASGETAAVHALSIDDGVKLRHQAPGFYGAAGTPGATRVADWVVGGGLLQVRSTLDGGTVLILR